MNWIEIFHLSKNFFSKHFLFVIIFSVLSFFIFIFSLGVLYWGIRNLPTDYFKKRFSEDTEYRAFSLFTLLLKNFVGIIILMGGILMLFIPGQGLLTIFFGLLLVNFPGKRWVEKKMISFSFIQKGLNVLRKKHSLDPFDFEFLQGLK